MPVGAGAADWIFFLLDRASSALEIGHDPNPEQTDTTWYNCTHAPRHKLRLKVLLLNLGDPADPVWATL